jgi:hypothetical protein
MKMTRIGEAATRFRVQSITPRDESIVQNEFSIIPHVRGILFSVEMTARVAWLIAHPDDSHLTPRRNESPAH